MFAEERKPGFEAGKSVDKAPDDAKRQNMQNNQDWLARGATNKLDDVFGTSAIDSCCQGDNHSYAPMNELHRGSKSGLWYDNQTLGQEQ
jgi:hypothetical protein